LDEKSEYVKLLALSFHSALRWLLRPCFGWLAARLIQIEVRLLTNTGVSKIKLKNALV
jgi:hypothetical protein